MKNLPAGHNRLSAYSCLILVTVLLFSLVSCAGEGDKTVMRVGGNKVTYNEYRYFYMNYRESHEKSGETGYIESLKNEVEEGLRQKYAKINLAKEHKITLAESDKTAIDNMKASYIESYGDVETFKNALQEGALTEELFYDLLKFQALDEKLRIYMTDEYSGEIESDDKTVEAFINNHFIHAIHILILNEAGDDLAANLKLAEELRQRAVSGEDFNELMDAYNEDPGMVNDNTGYYFTEGQIISEFENAAEVLAVGEISNVVLSENGYHIIKRLPLDPVYIDENFEKLRDAYKARMYNIIIEELAKVLEVEYTDMYTELDDAALVDNISVKKVK
ncbi:MAG: peptidylprolyl isomerase [Eubacteriales bacterium]